MVQPDCATDCFPGFAWAVPRAFAGALGACSFEEGDILYDAPRVYEGAWGVALRHLGHGVQVKSAPHPVAIEAEGQRESTFSKNWARGIELELIRFKTGKVEPLSSTHGRLYTLLWKGELGVLKEHSPAPPVPTLPMDLLRQRRIAATVSAFRERLSHDLARPIVFIMPYDETNKLLVEKQAKVQAALAGNFGARKLRKLTLSPSAAGLPSAAECVPTLAMLCFAVDCPVEDRVEATLKQALHAPSKDKKTDKEVFRVAAHGHLQAL